MSKRAGLSTIILMLLLVASPMAEAQQTLIPSPYPSAPAGGEPLNPAPAPTTTGGTQQIMRDPYPQAAGPQSQGNPTAERRHGGSQGLVPDANQRKYGVDRAPR